MVVLDFGEEIGLGMKHSLLNIFDGKGAWGAMVRCAILRLTCLQPRRVTLLPSPPTFSSLWEEEAYYFDSCMRLRLQVYRFDIRIFAVYAKYSACSFPGTLLPPVVPPYYVSV